MNLREALAAARVSTPVGTPSFDSPRGLGAFSSSGRQVAPPGKQGVFLCRSLE